MEGGFPGGCSLAPALLFFSKSYSFIAAIERGAFDIDGDTRTRLEAEGFDDLLIS